MGWDSCYLDLLDEAAGKLECAVAYDSFNGQVEELDHTEVDHILTNKEQNAINKSPRLILRDRNSGPTHGLRPFGNKSRRSASLIFVPCRTKDGISGILSVQSYVHNAYTDNDLKTAQSLGDHCAGALQRILAQQKLEASETRFRMVAEGLGEGIMITDLDDRVIYVNSRMAEMTGYTPEELIGQTEYELIQDESDWGNAIHRNQARERGLSERYELQMRRKDGTRFWADVCATPYRDPAGVITGTLGCASDIDARKRAEEKLGESERRLRQSQKMEAVGQLAAGIAHDFNNVMTIISVHAQLLKEEPNLSTDAQDSISDIAGAAKRAANLTSQLLAFSRKQAMSLSIIDLNSELRQLTKVFQSLLSERIALQTDYSAKAAIVNVDVGMIGQIVTNLVVNARDAMPNGGVLNMATSRINYSNDDEEAPQDYIRLTVADTGIGISESDLPHVFEPFFSTKDIGKGTGLGLSTVYGLVEQQGGRISVESQVDEGACFIIDFPAASGAPDAKSSTENEATFASQERELILAVEDEAGLRKVIENVLTRDGHQTLLAKDADEALLIWNRNSDRIRLLLTDIVMPGGISGFELAEMIQRQNPDLPVILTSGYSIGSNEQLAELQEGFNFLPKPFDSVSLSKIVQKRLRNPLEQRQ